jgi:RNA polymerase primary sigma factor
MSKARKVARANENGNFANLSVPEDSEAIELLGGDDDHDAQECALAASKVPPACETVSGAAFCELDTVGMYVHDLGRFKRTTAEEEIALAARIKSGDVQAGSDLVMANTRLVVALARKYAGLGVPLEDLIQEGNIGLIMAVGKYDPAEGRLGTYAVWWIKQRILRALMDQSRTVRVPVHVWEKIKKLNAAHASLTKKFERRPARAELAQAMKQSLQTVETVGQAAAQRTVPLDSPVADELCLCDVLPADDTWRPDVEVEQSETERSFLKAIDEAVAGLKNERSRGMVRMRFGLHDGSEWTLEEIGQHYSLTRERVRQIIAESLKWMRDKNPQLAEFLRP